MNGPLPTRGLWHRRTDRIDPHYTYVVGSNGKLTYYSPYMKPSFEEKYIPTRYISHIINSIRARDHKKIQEMQELEDYLFHKGAVWLWEYERK